MTTKDLLQSNEIVSGREIEYVIKAKLGEGLTAFVYLAQRQGTEELVALKVLKNEATATTSEYFWNEGVILSSLAEGGIAAVPRCFEVQRGDPVRFLALEYIDSTQYKPLDDQLREAPLTESATLAVVEQALALLDNLHTKVGYTYTDMQLKNFLWRPGDDALKVMDWNHVSLPRDQMEPEAFDDLVRKDLARFATYLYQMLTGKGASEQGEYPVALATRGRDAWTNVSLALRQVVTRALDPNLGRRYATAEEFLKAVQTVQDWWKPDQNADLLEQFDELLEAAHVEQRSKADLLRLDWAAAMLDILKRQQIIDADELQRRGARLKAVLQGETSAWAVGRAYYQAEQYGEACEKWAEEAKAQERIDLHRWVVLAKAGSLAAAEFEPVRSQLEAFVVALNERPLEPEAHRLLKGIQPNLTPTMTDAIQVLQAEVDVYRHLQDAQLLLKQDDWASNENLWQQAQESYQLASECLSKITYADVLRKDNKWVDEEGNPTPGDPGKRAEELGIQLAERKATQDQIDFLKPRLDTRFNAKKNPTLSKSDLNNQFENGLLDLKKFLQRDPGNLGVLNMCIEIAEQTLKTVTTESGLAVEALEQAVRLIDVGMFFGHEGNRETPLNVIRKQLLAERARRRELAEFEQLAREITTAADPNHINWEKLVDLTRQVLPTARLTTSPVYDTYASVHQKLNRFFDLFCRTGSGGQPNFLAAKQMDQILTLFEGNSAREVDARRSKLDQLEKYIKDHIEQVDKDLLQKKQELSKTQGELDTAQKDLGHQQRRAEFLNWANAANQEVNGLALNIPSNGFDAAIQKCDRLLSDAGLKFPELKNNDTYYTTWSQNLADTKRRFEEQAKDFQEIQKSIRDIETSLRNLAVSIGQWKLEMPEAERYLTQAKTLLSLPGFWSSQDPKVVSLKNLLNFCQALITWATEADSGFTKYKKANDTLETLDKWLEDPDSLSWEKVEPELNKAKRLVEESRIDIDKQQWQARLDRLGVHASLFQDSANLKHRIEGWLKLRPLSAGSRGLENLTSKIESIRTDFNNLSGKLSAASGDLQGKIQKLTETVDLLPKSLPTNRWPLIVSGLGAAAGLIAIAFLVFSSNRVENLAADVKALSTAQAINNGTAIAQQSAANSSLMVLSTVQAINNGTAIAQQSAANSSLKVILAAMPTTPTPTPTPTTPTTPTTPLGIEFTYDPASLNLPADPLYDIPPLIITATENWTITVENGQMSVTAPTGNQWPLMVNVYYQPLSSPQLQNGIAKDDSGRITWTPIMTSTQGEQVSDLQPLVPGDYVLEVSTVEASDFQPITKTLPIVSVPFTSTVQVESKIRTLPDTTGKSAVGPDVVAINDTLELLGILQKDGNKFARVRLSGTRRLYWAFLTKGHILPEDTVAYEKYLPQVTFP